MAEHFSSPQWADLVRGVAPDEVRGAMETHVRNGCPDCVEAYRLWKGVVVFVQDERGLTPPENALRVAKSYFAAQGLGAWAPPERDRSLASAIIATLLVDSLQTAPAGVRAGTGAYSRHLLFGAGSLTIDLHVDSGSRPGFFLLAGQLIDKSSLARPFARAAVSLVDGDVTISTFETNEFGEFQAALDLRKSMKLLVAFEHDIVTLPLDVLFDPSSPSSGKKE
ncbi:MAG TPA: hypothetical protein VGF24_01480 [Vicinamibacterales bacterium]